MNKTTRGIILRTSLPEYQSVLISPNKSDPDPDDESGGCDDATRAMMATAASGAAVTCCVVSSSFHCGSRRYDQRTDPLIKMRGRM